MVEIPHRPEQNGKGGFLVKVGDYKKIVNILVKLNLKAKIIKNKINNNYLYIKKNYKSNNTKEFIEILNKV
jgi:hypothetical protein